MARFGRRLNSVTRSGPDPTIDISPDQFAHLEMVYGVSLDFDARAELVEIANLFLYWHVAELISEPFEDVVMLFDRVKAAVGAFQEFAHGQLIGLSDAGSQLSGILDRHFHAFPVGVLPRHVSVLTDDGSREPIERSVLLELDHTLLSHIAISLGAAVGQAEKEIGAMRRDRRGGFIPGSTFNAWLGWMRDWAKRRGLPYGERGKDRQEPAPFAMFVFELNKLFGGVQSHETTKSLVVPVNSAQAMAQRLRRMSAEAGKARAGKGTK